MTRMINLFLDYALIQHNRRNLSPHLRPSVCANAIKVGDFSDREAGQAPLRLERNLEANALVAFFSYVG